MKKSPWALAVMPLLAAWSPLAKGNITITPTFDNSITRSPQASTIEATIDDAIAAFESNIANPISISIDFQGVSSGLGASSTAQGNVSYSTYRSDLASVASQSASDKTALASLPTTANTGINHNSQVTLSSALFLALGDQSEASTLESQNGGFDGVIELNLSQMNLSRSVTQDTNKYDLQSVASHEIDEVLGIGGSGSALYQPGSKVPALPTDAIGPTDLFRYTGPRQRSFTYDPFEPTYFSINGGRTDLTNFNQDGAGGSDFGDWAGAMTPQVQDAFGTPGTEPNLGNNELTALDVVGYTLTAPVSATANFEQHSIVTQSVPEPGSYACLALGALTVTAWRRRS